METCPDPSRKDCLTKNNQDKDQTRWRRVKCDKQWETLHGVRREVRDLLVIQSQAWGPPFPVPKSGVTIPNCNIYIAREDPVRNSNGSQTQVSSHLPYEIYDSFFPFRREEGHERRKIFIRNWRFFFLSQGTNMKLATWIPDQGKQEEKRVILELGWEVAGNRVEQAAPLELWVAVKWA